MLDGRRVVFVQPYVPLYREPFFASLRQKLAARGASLVVAVDRDQVSRRDQTADQVDVVLGSRLQGHLRLRPLAALDLAASDLVVMEQALKNLEVYRLAARRRYSRPGLALWGHGRSAEQSRVADRAKQWLTHRADWFFAYGRTGANWVVSNGFPPSRVCVVRNTIDGEALAQDLAAQSNPDVELFRERLGLVSGATALFLGGIDAHKDIDAVLRIAQECARMCPAFVLVVGGDGGDLPRLVVKARRTPWLRVMGRLAGTEKALALRSSSAILMPRSVGLVAVDAVIAGLPVVATAGSHGPEYEYLAPRGLLREVASAEPTLVAQALLTAMQDFTGSPWSSYEQQACLENGREWSIDGMADRFVAGLSMWAEIREARL